MHNKLIDGNYGVPLFQGSLHVVNAPNLITLLVSTLEAITPLLLCVLTLAVKCGFLWGCCK